MFKRMQPLMALYSEKYLFEFLSGKKYVNCSYPQLIKLKRRIRAVHKRHYSLYPGNDFFLEFHFKAIADMIRYLEDEKAYPEEKRWKKYSYSKKNG